jgi:DNA transformation protein
MGLSSFAEHAVDLLSGVGPVKVRAMFGGYGVSLNGISIGLIAEDRLYLRVDDETRAAFEGAGSAPFVYPSRKGPMTMKNYWALPEEAVDDPDKAKPWGRLAVAAAERAERLKRAKKTKPTPKAKPATASRTRAPRAKSRRR